MIMNYTINETITLETVTCYKCAVLFAMPVRFKQERLDYGAAFWCPNGHEQFFCKSRLTVVQEQLEKAQFDLRSTKCDLLREQDAKSKLEQKMKRVANGVCPCCKRSFRNLARHMKTKHPKAVKK